MVLLVLGSPWVDDWHVVLGITAGMNQKDCIAVVVFAVAYTCMAGFAGIAPRAVFLYFVVRPKMLRIMASMHQKDSYAVGWFLLVTMHVALCFLPVVVYRPEMLGIMAGMDQKYSHVGAWMVCW